ncbi:MAG: glycosyltransferase family 2 protein [Actinobacteria bacterium]|nr:glycosyltransferase family 2 protein [Actinomycetota bacterium]
MVARPGARPDVTVSIVSSASRQTLLALLASLEPELAGPASMEVVVLDNASEDGSVEAVSARFPWTRLIEQPFRAGFGANHNRVIGETGGRYVLLLSHDAQVEPGSLGRLVTYMEAHPSVGALAPRIRYPDGHAQASAWRFPSPAVSLLSVPTLSRAGVVQSRGERPRSVDWAMGAALLLRRTAIERVGLFDEERFFMYSEETDLCRRLADSGWETHFLPEVTVIHHDSVLRAEFPRERIAEEWRSRHRYWAKHHSRPGARLAATSTGIQYAARAGIARWALRDRDLAARMRLHARYAFRGVEGPGLRERAEEWNELAVGSRQSVQA